MARNTKRHHTNVQPAAFAIDVRDHQGNGIYPDARTMPEALRVLADMLEQYPQAHIELFTRTMDRVNPDGTYNWHETRTLEFNRPTA